MNPYQHLKINIFIFCFQKNVFSGGNDEKVLVHDLKTGQTLDVFPHDDPVYCVSPHPSHPELFATACSDGRILLFSAAAYSVAALIHSTFFFFFLLLHFSP